MPRVLLFTESDSCDRARKRTVVLSVVIVKLNADGVRVVIVLVDQHERPLAIRSQHCIGGYQNVAVLVFDITRGMEEPMFRILRLCPFLR